MTPSTATEDNLPLVTAEIEDQASKSLTAHFLFLSMTTTAPLIALSLFFMDKSMSDPGELFVEFCMLAVGLYVTRISHLLAMWHLNNYSDLKMLSRALRVSPERAGELISHIY